MGYKCGDIVEYGSRDINKYYGILEKYFFVSNDRCWVIKNKPNDSVPEYKIRRKIEKSEFKKIVSREQLIKESIAKEEKKLVKIEREIDYQNKLLIKTYDSIDDLRKKLCIAR